jgi:pSer/pThr/pTyr-binding forkhead associated (FHA) protein
MYGSCEEFFRMPYLIVLEDGIETSRVELFGPVTVGRMKEACDLVTRDATVSRRHCRIEPTSDGWLLTDLNSRNGTWVGHDKINQHALHEGDQVVLGGTTLLFSEASMPRQRPQNPTEALELARADAVGGESREPHGLWPRPLPYRWDEPPLSGSGLSDTGMPNR